MCGFLGTKRYLDVYCKMKTIACMTVLKVVDYSTYYCRESSYGLVARL